MKKEPSLSNNNPVKTSLYLDYSEWAINKSNIPDGIVFAGIIIDNLSLVNLFNEISRIKEQIRSPFNNMPNLPLKWCFGDLKRYYEENNQTNLYNILHKKRISWLTQISDILQNIPFKFIISIIKCHAKHKDALKKTKDKVIQFAFSNCLMKFGLYIKQNNLYLAEVVVDWPQRGNKEIYEEEYRTGFYYGKSANYGVRYKCGPLKDLGFSDSLFFSSTNECSVLQITDIIAGAFKDILKGGLSSKDARIGNEFIRNIKSKLHGAPNNLNYGIAIAPPKKEDPAFYNSMWYIIKNRIFN